MVNIILTISISSFVVGVLGDPPSAQFSNPPSAERALWEVGDIQTIKFQIPFKNFSIVIWQLFPGYTGKVGPTVFDTSDIVATQFDWAVQVYTFDLSQSNEFYFLVTENGYSPESGPWTMSPYFNITDENAVNISGTTIPTTSSNPLSTTTPPSSTITSEPTESENEGNTGEDPGGLSVRAKIGIGIPVTIVGLVAVFCAGCYLLKQKKTKQQRIDDVGRESSQPVVQEVLATTHSSGPFELPLRD